MVTREEYIKHYREHYRNNAESGSGVGLGIKPMILDDAGYEGGTLLDYGCGWGAILQGITPKSYLGVDIAVEAIELAKKHFPGNEFRVLEIGRLRTTKKDFVVAFSVFTHARYEDVPDCLKDIYNNLKIDGKALVDILEGDRNDNIHFTYWPLSEFVSELQRAGFKHDILYKRKAENGFVHTYLILTR